MARKRPQDGRRWFDHRYSTAYARTTGVWQTRQGRRNREFATFANLLGLNTAFDDFHKKDGESPYLRNVRYMGEKQITQRAQVTSRLGQKLLKTIGDVKSYPDKSEAQSYLEMYEGRSIEFDVAFSKTLVGGMLYIHNIEGAKGILRVILKSSKDSRAICDAVIDLEKVDRLDYQQKEFRFIQGIIEQNSVFGGTATIRLEMLDDVEIDTCGDSNPVIGRKIRILASGIDNHRVAESSLPNIDECLREKNYQFIDQPGVPLLGVITNGYKTLPRGIIACCNGKQHLVYPVINPNGDIELYRQELPVGSSGGCACSKEVYGRCSHPSSPGGDPIKINAPVWKDACAVRMAIAGGYIYYVDGNSPLQRIKICDWSSEIAIADADEIDSSIPSTPVQLQAKQGASLILNLRNRLYLSGFKDDPNFVQFSLIDGQGAKFDQFNEGFYSPDKSPADSACSPVTALSRLDNNLVVFREDGNSVFSAPTGLEFGKAQQLDTFSWNIGVPTQESVTEGNGQIYLWNRSEGFRRFAGTDSTFNSIAIDNELRRISSNSSVFMFAHANKVRLYFDRNNIGHADHSFLYYTILSGSSPWYMDDNTPVAWAIGDQNSDTVYAMHSQYPAVFIIDEENQFKDFDSSIKMEYSTPYKGPGDLMGHTILRRVQLKIMQNSTNSWFVGIDPDHRDNPAVWRRLVRAQLDSDNNDDSIFDNTAEAGSQTLNIVTRMKCRDFQVRVLVYCYRSRAELLLIVGEYGGVNPL